MCQEPVECGAKMLPVIVPPCDYPCTPSVSVRWSRRRRRRRGRWRRRGWRPLLLRRWPIEPPSWRRHAAPPAPPSPVPPRPPPLLQREERSAPSPPLTAPRPSVSRAPRTSRRRPTVLTARPDSGMLPCRARMGRRSAEGRSVRFESVATGSQVRDGGHSYKRRRARFGSVAL